MAIKLSNLSPQEKKELLEQAKAEELSQKQKQMDNRKAYKELVGEVVPKFFRKLTELSSELAQAKHQLFFGVKDLIVLKKEAYDIKETQQTYTLTSEDGDKTIKIGYRVNDGWGDTHHAGIDKMNEFIGTLVKDDDTKKLVKTINRLLQKDANGILKSSRVLELEKIAEDFNSELLDDGISIIRKAWKPKKFCYFAEAFYADGAGKKVNVPLSISSVDFPNNEKIDFI